QPKADIRIAAKSTAIRSPGRQSRQASWGMSSPQQSRMWTPWRGRQQLDFLCHDKRPELRGKAFHELLVGENSCPVLPPVGVVIKLPEMDELVDRAGVGLEVAQELVVMAALLERRWRTFRRSGYVLVKLPYSLSISRGL